MLKFRHPEVELSGHLMEKNIIGVTSRDIFRANITEKFV